jgi:hypothetical protein
MKLLRDALTLLASPPRVQLEHLKALGVPEGIDELALEYDDIAASAESMFKEGELDNHQCNCVKQLNEFLAQFSGQNHADLWTPEALSSAPQWEQVRRMAADCLKQLE